MTKRLYYEDSHLFSCEAIVLTCIPAGKGADLVLDQTVFFPNAGGQPCDTGTLLFDGVTVPVTGCDEKDGLLVHHCEKAVPEGARVTLTIDRDRRLDLMQQHSGEHLLSYCASLLFGANNVGFHLNLEEGTVDLDRSLTPEQVLELELYTNRLLRDDRAISAVFCDSPEEASRMGLRKQAEGLTLPIRVVMIEGADRCTCCAPHCSRTGEIGLVLIRDAMALRGGIRLTFLCGERALRHSLAMHAAVDSIARSFSTGRDKAVSAVERLQLENGQLRRRERELSEAVTGLTAASLREKRIVSEERSILIETVGECDLKELADALILPAAAVVLFREENGRLRYIVETGERFSPAAGELIALINKTLGGKGGGRGGIAQGSAPLPSDPENALTGLKSELLKAGGMER